MRTLVHLSDLHFGAVRPTIVDALTAAVIRLQPNLVVVSGDLTQRARRREFFAAREFLAALPFPKLVVPGNHDVPLYNLWARFHRQLRRYHDFISQETEPFFLDDEIAVQGINTARALTFKNGRVNERQIALAHERLAPLNDVIKIIVTHHPFDLPQEYPERILVGRARSAMVALARCGIDLFLAGHHHIGMAQPSTLRFKVGGHAALLVQAGTATSTRSRGEMNSFNVLRIVAPYISVERMVWHSSDSFSTAKTEHFRRESGGWTRCPDSPDVSQISAAGT